MSQRLETAPRLLTLFSTDNFLATLPSVAHFKLICLNRLRRSVPL